jgi:hypothetical protein
MDLSLQMGNPRRRRSHWRAWAVRHGRGRAGEAESTLRQALAIFQRIGAAQAAGVSAELDALPAASNRLDLALIEVTPRR